MNLLDAVIKELDEGVDFVRDSAIDLLDFTEDLTRKGRLKLEIQQCYSDVREQMTLLGGRTHEIMAGHVATSGGTTSVMSDPTVQEIYARIGELQQQIKNHKAELEKLEADEE